MDQEGQGLIHQDVQGAQDAQDAQKRESFILSILVFGVSFGGRGGKGQRMETDRGRPLLVIRGLEGVEVWGSAGGG